MASLDDSSFVLVNASDSGAEPIAVKLDAADSPLLPTVTNSSSLATSLEYSSPPPSPAVAPQWTEVDRIVDLQSSNNDTSGFLRLHAHFGLEWKRAVLELRERQHKRQRMERYASLKSVRDANLAQMKACLDDPCTQPGGRQSVDITEQFHNSGSLDIAALLGNSPLDSTTVEQITEMLCQRYERSTQFHECLLEAIKLAVDLRSTRGFVDDHDGQPIDVLQLDGIELQQYVQTNMLSLVESLGQETGVGSSQVRAVVDSHLHELESALTEALQKAKQLVQAMTWLSVELTRLKARKDWYVLHAPACQSGGVPPVPPSDAAEAPDHAVSPRLSIGAARLSMDVFHRLRTAPNGPATADEMALIEQDVRRLVGAVQGSLDTTKRIGAEAQAKKEEVERWLTLIEDAAVSLAKRQRTESTTMPASDENVAEPEYRESLRVPTPHAVYPYALYNHSALPSDEAEQGDTRVYWWLHQQGLAKYYPALVQQKITWERLGVALGGDRELQAAGINAPSARKQLLVALRAIDKHTPHAVLKKGWLIKKGATVKNWKNRFGILLSNGCLHYFVNEDSPKPKGFIDLSLATSVALSSEAQDVAERANAIDVVTPKRIYVLCFPSPRQRDEWLHVLRKFVYK